MRILMVGAGATGGFYGGLLARAGRDVTFLLREGRARQIREQGLEIVLHTGEEITLHPPVVTAAELQHTGQAFDLVILSTKSYQLAAAMDDIEPAVGPETMILPILNGMRQLTVLGERFGPEKVLGGSIRIMSFLDDRNRAVQMNALDQMNYGELSGERTARILAVDEQLRGCGFTANLVPDIVDALWQKWMILTSLGATCILGGGHAGQINAAPRGPEMIRAVVQECVAIGTANGHPPEQETMQAHVERMLEPGSTISSSMYRDMSSGAPVEADHIVGDLLDHAQDVPAPLLMAAYVRLKVYEASRSA